MTDLIKFDPMEEMPNFIKVLGVGGGGSNAVTHMFTEGIQGVDFILCNTDYQALEKSPVATKIHLGKRLLGAGNVPAVGREAAMETTEEIREILSRDTKMLFITAGMGGGTGTGAAPVVASVARELGILTVGIVTMPFSFEGKRRYQQALDGIAELRKNVDCILVISNDKLRDTHGNMKLTQAFKKADDVLKTAAKGIAEIITVTGYVNVDFQDVNTVMQRSGKAVMGSGYAEGDDRAAVAVEQAVNSPLLDDSEISGAKNILIYITSGTEEVSLDEVTQIVEYVQDATGNCSEVIWGNGTDESLGNGINVTLIATGFHDDNNGEKEIDTNSVKVHEMYEQVTSKNTHEDNQATKPEQRNEEILVVNRKKEEEETTDNPQKKKIHTLDPVNNNDDDDEGGVRVSNRNDTNKNFNTSSDRNNDAVKTPNRVYNNPFNNDDDDEDLGITSYVRDSADTQTMMKHKVKPKQKTNDLSQQEIMRRQRLGMASNFRSMDFIHELETKPAYMRKGLSFGVNDQEQELSAYSFNKEKGISENNTYLHDNVD